MPLTSGTRLGSYENVARFGVGGMGEAYSARGPRRGRAIVIGHGT
jgi:hypothetical protein